MIYYPTNEEIEVSLKKRDLNYKIEIRRELESNPFSKLEIIKFLDIKKEFVLKSVDPVLKSEIFIHNLANNDPLTAAKLLSFDIDKKLGKYFILMEKISYEPLFNLQFNSQKTIEYYKKIAKKLANFHLKFSNIENLANHEIPVYGISKYESIISGLGNRLENLSKIMDHETMLSEDLVGEFTNYIGSIRSMLKPFQDMKLTLVHGDFDTGNIIINNADKDIYAIDYGLAHIDVPIIDIAHLLSATAMNINTRRDIFEIYYDRTNKLFPASLSLQDVRNAGRMMHLIYFLDWYLFAIEKELVPSPIYYFEQIHNRVHFLNELLKHPND